MSTPKKLAFSNSPLIERISSPIESERRVENRKARRRREKEKRAQEEAGSSKSNVTAGDGSKASKTRTQDAALTEKSAGPSWTNGSFGEEDFIAFTFTDEDEGKEEEEEEKEEKPVREWDKGKGKDIERERDTDRAGRKRRVDEYDLTDGYSSKKERVAAASRKAPWLGEVDFSRCNNVTELLHRDVEAFVHYISPTPEEDEIRSLVVGLITRAVTEVFSDAQVYPFGSYETKLYLPLGDIDLVVHSPSMAYSDKVDVLHALANTVKRAGIADKVQIIAKAKVPIIKFVTTHGRFPVDISVNQVNGVAAGQMIKHFLGELPALRGLVLVVKSFLSQRSMNEVYTGGLGSYSIVCMVISFLQMHPKIRRGEIDPSKNLGVLVMEFFELYGCYFNYMEVGISVRSGGTYFNKAQRGWLDQGQPRLLSIEDPGDPSNDISRGSYGIARVRATLAGAHSIMTAAAYAQARMISSMREGTYTPLRGALHPEDMSILASVMGITQETINHRRMVKEVYDRRALHRMMGVTARSTHKTSTNGQEYDEEEADMELGSDEEVHSIRNVQRHKDTRPRQPPRKRRKSGQQQDLHTVFTTDDEDLQEGDAGKDFAEYNLNGTDEDGEEQEGRSSAFKATKSSRSSSRRDFWLSKGFSGIADDSDSG